MGQFLKGLGSALYQRIFVAKKTTLLGLGLEAAAVVVEQLQIASLPTWAHALVGVAATILVFYKGKALPAPQVVP